MYFVHSLKQRYRGEFEERLQAIVEELTNPKAPPTILFIDEIHNLVGAGAAEGGMDAANLLKPALARGELQLIGATTIAEYRKVSDYIQCMEKKTLRCYRISLPYCLFRSSFECLSSLCIFHVLVY